MPHASVFCLPLFPNNTTLATTLWRVYTRNLSQRILFINSNRQNNEKIVVCSNREYMKTEFYSK